MSQKHISSTLQIRNTPIPIDEYTYTYADFNQSLVGVVNQNVPEIYTTSWTPTEYKANIVERGKHGLGISLDEYTYNIWTEDFLKPYNYEIDNLVGEYSQIFYNLCGTEGAENNYLWSFDLEVINTTADSIRMFYLEVQKYKSGSFLGGLKSQSIYKDEDKIYFYFTIPPNDGTWDQIRIKHCFERDIASHVILKNTQVIEKSYNVTPVDGTRNSPFLRYKLLVNPKTVSFWFKSNSNKETDFGDTPRHLYLQGYSDGVEGLDPDNNPLCVQCVIGPDNNPVYSDGSTYLKNKVAINVKYSNTNNVAYIDEVDPLDGKWHFVCVENYGTSFRLHVDDYYSDLATPGMPYEIGNYIFLGNNGYMPGTNSYEISNCTYDDLCIRTKTYDKDEVHSWYFSDREFYNPYDYSVIV